MIEHPANGRVARERLRELAGVERVTQSSPDLDQSIERGAVAEGSDLAPQRFVFPHGADEAERCGNRHEVSVSTARAGGKSAQYLHRVNGG